MKSYFTFRSLALGITLMLFFSLKAYSQQVINAIPEAQKTNYFEMKSSFDKQIEGKDLKKTKGWKQFKRWEYFWRSRVNPDGSFPDGNLLWNESKKFRTDINDLKKKKDKALSTTWSPLGPTSSAGGYAGLGRLNCVIEKPGNSSVLWTGAASGGLWKTTNGGTSWTTNTDELASIGISDIAIDPTPPYNIMYIATGDRDAGDTYSVGVLKSTDEGGTWSTTGLTWGTYQYGRIGRLLINPTSVQVLLAATNGGIYRTTNGGTNWSQVQSGIFKDMEFMPGNPNVVYASGTNIYKSVNGGQTWQPLSSGLPVSNIGRVAIAVAPSDANVLYAVYSKATDYGLLGVYKSTDAGETFNEVKNDDAPNILGWYGDGSDQGGQGYYDLCITVVPNNANTIFVGGINVWKSTNGGADWNPVAIWTDYFLYNPDPPGYPVVHADHHDLYFLSNSSAMYSSNDGGLYKTTNQGTSWDYIGSGIVNTQFYKLGTTEDDDGLIIGGCQDNGTKILDGGVWTDVIGGDGMECMIDHGNSSIMYGSLYYGDFRKSTDGGVNFVQKMNGITEQGAWVTPFAMDPNDANIIWGGYNNIFRTTNGGTNWTQKSNFGTSTPFDILKIASANTAIVIAAYTNGTTNTVKKTTNSGDTWGSITVPNGYLKDIEIDPDNTDKLLLAYGAYSATNKVQYSTNFGSNWSNITGNLPNVPVNCIIREDGSASNRIWIGTDIGVWYCDNYSGTWVAYNDGLPNVVITELAINYTSRKLTASTYGRGLWRADIPGVPVQVVLSSPDNNVTLQPVNGLELSWLAASGAASYHVQVSASSNMSSPIVDATGVAGLTSTLNGLSNNTKYYWKVIGEGAGDFLWSEIRNFTTIFGVPNLTSPTDNAKAVPVAGLLQWQALSGATSYKVQISTNKDFTPGSIVVDETGVAGTSFDYSSASLDYSTLYFWRVYGVNGATVGGASAHYQFTTQLEPPVLTYPANNAKSLAIDDTLRWEAVTGAITYNIYVAADAQFTTIKMTQLNVSVLHQKLNGLDYNTAYYWKVIAVNADGAGDKSEIRTFKTVLNKPGLTSPLNHALNAAISGDLEWGAVAGAVSYKLRLSTESDFSSNIEIDEEGITETSYAYGPLSNLIKYYWKVKAINADGESDWSETSDFTTIFPPPALTAPENQAIDMPLAGILDFEAVAQAATYNLQLSEFQNFQGAMILNQTGLTETQSNYTGLENSKTYYWRVSASDGSGKTSPWSEVWSFSTEAALGTVSLVSPANSAVNVNLNPVLIWKALDGADSYEYELSTSTAFGAGTIVKTQAGLADTSTNITPALDFNKQYYWRARASVGGNNTEWSAVWSFTTAEETIVILAPVLILPADNALNIPINGQLSWNASAGADKYTVQISTSANFAAIFKEGAGLSATSINYTNLNYETKYYWRAKAMAGANESEWSAVRNFTTEKKKEVPDNVALVGPKNNVDKIKKDDLLIWLSAPGADSYTLEISKNKDFSSNELMEEGLTDTSYIYPGLEGGGVYYWRVKAVYGAEETGWSAVWKFIAESQLEIPVPLSPANNAVGTEPSGALQWNAVNGAESYNIQISQSMDFSAEAGQGDMLFDAPGIATNSYDYNGFIFEKKYYWRLNQTSGGKSSSWSEIWSFTVKEETGVEDGAAGDGIRLNCYPNPFTKMTVISFELPSPAYVTLTIYNAQGEKVALLAGDNFAAGAHKMNWEAETISSGTYIAILVAGNSTKTMRLVLNK